MASSVLLLGACAQPEEPPREQQEEQTDLGIPMSAPIAGPEPGDIKDINLPSGRSYLLSVPDDYNGDQQWPLVLAFHGWGETPLKFLQYSAFNEAEAIVAFPKGEDKAWAPAPYAETSADEDQEFVEQVIDTLRATYSIDDSRIFATGMSNGGGFAAYLGCQMPETFNSIASISAAYYHGIHEGCSNEPVGRLDIHGTDDPIVGYWGGKRHGRPYSSVESVLDRDAERNECSNQVATSRLANQAIKQDWIGCAEPLEHIRIGGGRHIWPGGAHDASQEVGAWFATDSVLDFFAIPGRPAGTPDV